MFIVSIIIKKGINYLLSDGKSTAKSVYYLYSRSVNNRRHSLKLTLKFRYGTFSPQWLQPLLGKTKFCIMRPCYLNTELLTYCPTVN